MASAVGSPISLEIARKMTDDQWISAMQKYDGTTDRFRGGNVELSRVLATIAHEDRVRFAGLLDRMPEEVHPYYFGAILNALSGRHANLSAEEKEQDCAILDEMPIDLFAAAIARCHQLPNRACGKEIADLIESLAHRDLPTELFEILKWYSTESPDPKEDIWKDKTKNYYGGKPFDHGINTVRGRAALAIGELVANEPERVARFRDTLRKMAGDPVTSVRCCVVEALRRYPAEYAEEAVELFARCVEGREDVALGSTFGHFFQRFFLGAQPELLPMLENLLASDNEKIRLVSAKFLVMAELGGLDTGGLAEKVFGGDSILRRKAAEVTVRHVSRDASDEVVARAAERLEESFNDEDGEVRSTAARCFRGMSGKRLQTLEATVRRFINSHAFVSNPSDLFYELERSRVKMPEVIHLAVERLLDTIGSKAADFQHRVARAGMSAAALVVRQYVQSKDAEVRKRCMELIDRMDALGYSGVADELEKLDR